jgi:hypothetical protein
MATIYGLDPTVKPGAVCRGHAAADVLRSCAPLPLPPPVTFMTLEDDTGFVNVAVWRRVFSAHATLIKTANFRGVSRQLQKQGRRGPFGAKGGQRESGAFGLRLVPHYTTFACSRLSRLQ